jgi:hypothetical protein
MRIGQRAGKAGAIGGGKNPTIRESNEAIPTHVNCVGSRVSVVTVRKQALIQLLSANQIEIGDRIRGGLRQLGEEPIEAGSTGQDIGRGVVVDDEV